jgi:GWxTD domain-containing protein
MSSRRIASLLTAAPLLLACAGRQQIDPDEPPSLDAPRTVAGRPGGTGGVGSIDAAGIYQRMGLIVTPNAPVPFVGTVRYVATGRPDSTLALLALSMANRALTFSRDNDRYRAVYEVRAEFRQGTQPARRIEAQQEVRVASYREISRGDESVIFQQTLALAPGQYTLSLAVRDVGSARSSVQDVAITVPRFGPTSLASPVAVYEATPRASTDSAPRLVATPRSTFTFGRDTAAAVYLEGYGTGAALPLRLTLLGDRDAALWTDTVSLARRGALFSGLVRVPLAPLGVGRVVTLVAERSDTRESARAPMFVSFGDELPITTFEDMLGYLRFFGPANGRESLRNAPAAGRAAAWAEFLRTTDPTPSTPQNEALRDYFVRVGQANARYREEGGQGWLTDRGRVYVTLGDPDQRLEQGDQTVTQRGRAQIWVYHQHGLQLVFVDQTGFGRWRLTTSSESEFESIASRERK